MEPVLSILIPSIPDRLAMAVTLYRRLELVMKAYPVEILLLTDNHIRTIGEKRDTLKNLCKGRYFAFVDDDDKISDHYNQLAQAATIGEVDVITFKQHTIINGEEAVVDFDLNHKENERWQPDIIVKRRPWHVCAWRRELVQDIPFPHSGTNANYGEDWIFCEKALERVKTQHKINEVLHTYIHSTEATAAPLEI